MSNSQGRQPLDNSCRWSAFSPGRGDTGSADILDAARGRHRCDVSPLPGLRTNVGRFRPGADAPGYYKSPSGLNLASNARAAVGGGTTKSRCRNPVQTARGQAEMSRHRWHNGAVQLALATVWLSIVASTAVAADLPFSPEQPYQAQRTNPVTYQVNFCAIVTAPYQTKQLRVWLPIPQTDYGQEVAESKLSTFPLQVDPQIDVEKVFGNKFAYFEFASPKGAQIIRHEFTVKVWELNWQLDAGDILTVNEWPRSFDRYRSGDEQSVVVDERFVTLLDTILPKRANPLTDLGSVMNWVNQNFVYDHTAASLSADAVHALQTRRGHCSDYHSFCASMGRVIGFPTRVTYGINPFPKESPSHCKLEAFLPPYGWVSFDVSETHKLLGEIQKNTKLSPQEQARLTSAAQQRLISGFRDNTWFLQTRGTDYALVPPATRRVPVVRTIYVEADGQPLAEPDPANKEQRAYSWMTAHAYVPDRAVTYPFVDISSLKITKKSDNE